MLDCVNPDRIKTQPCRLPARSRASLPPERKARAPLPQVLVVDDSQSILVTLSELLRKDYDVVTAHGGAEALQSVAEAVPDVILVDWFMPNLGGLAVCASVKASARTRHVPVLMMTGSDTPERRAAGLDAGADDFLAKPFDPVELFARIRNVLRTKRRFEELQAAARMREQLSQMIVHDLRSPLTGVTLALDLLRDAPAHEESAEFIVRANHGLVRANDMLSDLLLVAKIKAGQFTVARAPVAVAKALDDVAADAELMARARGLTVHVEAPRDEPPWPVDRTLVRRVVENLLNNAIKHSPRGAAIVLRAAPRGAHGPSDGGVLQIDVIDRGAGVAPQHRAHLFESFRSFSQSEQPTQPIGLGLAFCKLATEAHGGSIAYAPNEPQGSVFTARFAV